MSPNLSRLKNKVTEYNDDEYQIKEELNEEEDFEDL